MNCSTCNTELERIKRKKYQKILLTDSKRYFCYNCKKKIFKANLLVAFLNLFKFNFK